MEKGKLGRTNPFKEMGGLTWTMINMYNVSFQAFLPSKLSPRGHRN